MRRRVFSCVSTGSIYICTGDKRRPLGGARSGARIRRAFTRAAHRCTSIAARFHPYRRGRIALFALHQTSRRLASPRLASDLGASVDGSSRPNRYDLPRPTFSFAIRPRGANISVFPFPSPCFGNHATLNSFATGGARLEAVSRPQTAGRRSQMEGGVEEHQTAGGQIRPSRLSVPSVHGLGKVQVRSNVRLPLRYR